MNKNEHKDDKVATTIVVNDSLFYIGTSEKKGRGLFAAVDIPASTVIHVAPCILVVKHEYDSHAKHTIFEHYLFNDTMTGDKLLALGYGSLFNHDSYHPNVLYNIQSRQQTITYKSGVQTIPKDTELCISYGSNLWFDDDDKGCTTKASDDSTDDDDNNDDAGNFLNRIEC